MAASATHQAEERPQISLTDRGRIRAILAALDERWDGMHPWDRARARELLEQLARCYRVKEVSATREG